MKNIFKILAFAGFLMFMFSVDVVNDSSLKMAFVGQAEAVIGHPMTPMSGAGVARRTTRRVVATTAAVETTAAATHAAAAPPPPAAPPPAGQAVPIGTVIPALPAGCTSVVVGGVNYSDCAGVFYKSAFQGNNLVYVVVQKPMQ